jgi:predicted O-methyltransferase YrrM
MLQKIQPDDPWLTDEAIDLLDRLIQPTDVALEFGAGRSTLWLARRVAKLTSVEHDHNWSEQVSTRLKSARLDNVDFLHIKDNVSEAEGATSSYVRVLDRFNDQSLDLVLVDGIYRNHCAVGCVPKVKSGGLVILDNANWFLPSTSRAPSSRKPGDGPADAVWAAFAETTGNWRRIMTSNGVSDTLLLFKC